MRLRPQGTDLSMIDFPQSLVRWCPLPKWCPSSCVSTCWRSFALCLFKAQVLTPSRSGAPTTFCAKPMQMTGMFRVAEKNLENLNAAQLKNLMRKGIMARVYMHLMSLENFGRLLDRKAGRGKPS